MYSLETKGRRKAVVHYSEKDDRFQLAMALEGTKEDAAGIGVLLVIGGILLLAFAMR